MAPLSLASPTTDNTVGAVFLGLLGACALFGVTSLQAYIYFHTYPEDALLHKVSVSLLWLLDAFSLVLTIHAMYAYIVTGVANHDGPIYIIWSMKLQVAIVVVIILLVQSLYAYRVWKLSGYHRGWLRYLVACAVAAGFGIGIALAYSTYKQKTYDDLRHISWALISALASATVIDFILSFTMCYYLRKSKTSAYHLNSRISTIMQYSLSSGLLTSTCSLATLFTYILCPYTLIFVGLEFLLTRLYVGSFFAMLNARKPRQDGELSVSRTTVDLEFLEFRVTNSMGSDGRAMSESNTTIAAMPRKLKEKRSQMRSGRYSTVRPL